MLAGPKLNTFLDLIRSSSREEQAWMSGYLSGMLASGQLIQELQPQILAEPVTTAPPAGKKITIAYATETGNSKKLATDFAAKAKKNGIPAKLVSLDQYRLTDLDKEEYFFTVISTQGDGEPPATAKKFYDHIYKNGFKVSRMKFGVLALGDTSYPLFCKAGEDVDAQLHKLGGQRIISLQKCDTDYSTDADAWFSQVLRTLSETSAKASPSVVPAVTGKKTNVKKIYNGRIITNVNLNDRGSHKQTHHIEIVAEGLEYQPGDSIGIIAENPKSLVDQIISLSGVDGNRIKKLNIAWLPERVVKQYAAIVKQDIPETKISLCDLLKIYPVNNATQFESIINILEPIIPRLYSISSSYEANNGEVHITVAREIFSVNDEKKYGLCSDYLVQLPVDSSLEFYVQKNHQFRLPAPDKDMIMIGPGTGIAPFRAFLSERDATGATGRNWLFFGDQHFTTDFLYQSEIQNWVQTGLLTNMNVAFSRDQPTKIYVQHKMLEHSAAFYDWLQKGAYIYVCGAQRPMSVDVEYTILQIIERYGNKSSVEAIQYLDQLKEEGRYLKDVY